MNAKKLFDFGVELSRSIQRDNSIYAQETVKQNAVVPSEELYTGPLDAEGRIPVAIDQFEREGEEDRFCGKMHSRKRQFDWMNEKD